MAANEQTPSIVRVVSVFMSSARLSESSRASLTIFRRRMFCLLPSDQESFGLAALEAMACEVPVIASRVGGLPEVVTDGETGYLEPGR